MPPTSINNLESDLISPWGTCAVQLGDGAHFSIVDQARGDPSRSLNVRRILHRKPLQGATKSWKLNDFLSGEVEVGSSTFLTFPREAS